MLELDTEHPSLVAGIFGRSLTIPDKSDFFLEIVNHCEICLQAEGKGDKEEDFMYLWHHFLTRWN